MFRRDLPQSQLYEAVKLMIETDRPHLHLGQQKLFTLFSISFQYLLYQSTKEPGNYLIRVEDSRLLEKLIRKSKDVSTRNFMQKLALPRKIKVGSSMLFLDFFNIGSWGLTNDLPPDKFRAAIIVKDTVERPIDSHPPEDEEEDEAAKLLAQLPPFYYATSLIDIMPRTVHISLGEPLDKSYSLKFPFIKEEREVTSGVKISHDVNLDDLE
jgi:hypothetical protein